MVNFEAWWHWARKVNSIIILLNLHTVGAKSMSLVDVKLLLGNFTALHHNTKIFSIKIN